MRRRNPRAVRNLFSDWRPSAVREYEGNYATRCVVRWIMSDPRTAAESRRLSNAGEAEEWFADAVLREEVSTAYAKFLMESTDIQWPLVLNAVREWWPPLHCGGFSIQGNPTGMREASVVLFKSIFGLI